MSLRGDRAQLVTAMTSALPGGPGGPCRPWCGAPCCPQGCGALERHGPGGVFLEPCARPVRILLAGLHQGGGGRSDAGRCEREGVLAAVVPVAEVGLAPVVDAPFPGCPFCQVCGCAVAGRCRWPLVDGRAVRVGFRRGRLSSAACRYDAWPGAGVAAPPGFCRGLRAGGCRWAQSCREGAAARRASSVMTLMLAGVSFVAAWWASTPRASSSSPGRVRPTWSRSMAEAVYRAQAAAPLAAARWSIRGGLRGTPVSASPAAHRNLPGGLAVPPGPAGLLPLRFPYPGRPTRSSAPGVPGHGGRCAARRGAPGESADRDPGHGRGPPKDG